MIQPAYKPGEPIPTERLPRICQACGRKEILLVPPAPARHAMHRRGDQVAAERDGRAPDQRAYVTQDGLAAIAENDRVVTRLRAARARAAEDAIKNLARYKFSNFGYHAARWVTLNALIGDRQPNPFRAFVELARKAERQE